MTYSRVGISEQDWAFDYESGLWLRGRPGDEYKTDEQGYLWVSKRGEGSTPPPAPSTWAWPPAEPYLGDGTYSGEYPTHYNWREDVEEVARYLVDTYGVWCNTYSNHPPGWWLDSVSLDVWAYEGRGYAIDPDLGQQVFDDIFHNGKPPWIWWTIWWGRMWSVGGGDEPAPWGPPGSDPNHYNHIHFTFW